MQLCYSRAADMETKERKVKVQLEAACSVVDSAGVVLDANAYIFQKGNEYYIAVASRGGTGKLKEGERSSNNDRAAAVETIRERLKLLHRNKVEAYKCDIKKAELYEHPREFMSTACDSKPNYPYGQASFAITFDGMTENAAEYLVTGRGTVWHRMGEDEMTWESGAVPMRVLDSLEPERRQQLVGRIVRDAQVAEGVRCRDGHKCVLCKRNEHAVVADSGLHYVEVHHVVYLSQGGRDAADNMVTLCPHHHAEIHHATAKRRGELDSQIQAYLSRVQDASE